MSTPADTILTDGQGRPIEKPTKPPKGSDLESQITYMRALWAYNDAVADAANNAFDQTFRKSIK